LFSSSPHAVIATVAAPRPSTIAQETHPQSCETYATLRDTLDIYCTVYYIILVCSANYNTALVRFSLAHKQTTSSNCHNLPFPCSISPAIPPTCPSVLIFLIPAGIVTNMIQCAKVRYTLDDLAPLLSLAAAHYSSMCMLETTPLISTSTTASTHQG